MRSQAQIPARRANGALWAFLKLAGAGWSIYLMYQRPPMAWFLAGFGLLCFTQAFSQAAFRTGEGIDSSRRQRTYWMGEIIAFGLFGIGFGRHGGVAGTLGALSCLLLGSFRLLFVWALAKGVDRKG